MKGILVTNHFLRGKKFDEITSFFLSSAKKQNVPLLPYTNCEMTEKLSFPAAASREFLKKESIDFILFWDKDIRLASYLETLGVRVFNSSEAIEACDDKSLMYIKLCGSSIPMPKTAFSPKMFFRPESFPDNYPESFVLSLEKVLSYPIVVKECYGSFGYQVYLAKNRESLIKLISDLAPSPLVFQEFIKTSPSGIGGHDLRLHVVGDRVVTAMERYNTDDFRANITNGGKMSPHTPSKEEEEIAIAACRSLCLDFAGVDLLVNEKGQPILCEVNSNAHFVNIFSCTGVNVADSIIEHIKKELS